LFAAEIETNTVPSIGAIKDRAQVGTAKARAICDQLARLTSQAEPEAAQRSAAQRTVRGV
jgi:hypothetical protein